MSIISIIVAMDRNRVIGKNGILPWNLPADKIHFKRTTIGHPVIMGRKTFQSIGEALPGRTNIVLSKRKDTYAPGCVVVNSVDAAIWLGRMSEGGDSGEDEIFIIGGGEVYQDFLGRADRLYITRMDIEIEGDTQFPEVDWMRWELVSEVAGVLTENDQIPHTFQQYNRIK